MDLNRRLTMHKKLFSISAELEGLVQTHGSISGRPLQHHIRTHDLHNQRMPYGPRLHLIHLHEHTFVVAMPIIINPGSRCLLKRETKPQRVFWIFQGL